MSAMEVDLLTNALVPNAEAASGGPEPMAAKAHGGGPEGIEQAQAIMPRTRPIGGSGQSGSDKPSKDFAETLEEKMQVETPEVIVAAQSADAVAGANVPSSAQSESVSSKVSADLADEVGKIVVETANIPQGQAVTENSQLVANPAVSTPLEIAAGQVEAAAMPGNAQAAGELPAMPVEQGEIQSEGEQPSQGMPVVTSGAQAAQASQNNTQNGSNEDSAATQEMAVDEETGELLNESLGEGDKAQVSGQKVGNAVGRNVANTDPVPKDSADAGKEASSDPQGENAKTEPGITASVFADVRARAEGEEQTRTLPQSSENSGKDVLGNEEAGSSASPVQKLDPGRIEPVVSKSNVPETPAPEAAKSTEFEQAVPAETPQISAPEQPLDLEAPNSPASPLPAENTATLSEQIRESITSSTIGPDQEITIRLNPPELGTVVVKFQEQDNQITGILEVSKSQTRAEIQQVLPEIMRDLQDFGVQIKRIEVVMASEQESETLSGQSAMPQDDRWAGQEGPGGFEPDAPGGSVGGVFAQGSPYIGSAAYSQSYVNDKSIDMFV